MSADLDRFDRMLLAAVRPAPAPEFAPASPRLQRAPSPSPVEREPVISSKRGPRFVDYATCPMCGHERIGVVYLGISIKGPKMHELFAHSPGFASSRRGEPRCLGAGLRVVFENGNWRGAPS